MGNEVHQGFSLLNQVCYLFVQSSQLKVLLIKIFSNFFIFNLRDGNVWVWICHGNLRNYLRLAGTFSGGILAFKSLTALRRTFRASSQAMGPITSSCSLMIRRDIWLNMLLSSADKFIFVI